MKARDLVERIGVPSVLTCVLLASCNSTGNSIKDAKPTRVEQIQAGVVLAYQDMHEKLVKGNDGPLQGISVAFVARAKPVPYIAFERSFSLDNPGAIINPERKEGVVMVDNYVDLIRSFAEQKNANEGHFQVYDRDALAAVMKSIEIRDANELFVQGKAVKLREASVQYEPLDGLVLLEMTGVQNTEDSPTIHWTIECKFTDIRAGGMPPMVGFSRWTEDIDTKSLRWGAAPPPRVSMPSSPAGSDVPRPDAPRLAGSDAEPNNSVAEAQTISLPGSVSGKIGVNDMEDWYIVTAPSDGHLSITMTNTKPTGADGASPVAELRNATGTALTHIGKMWGSGQSHTSNKQPVTGGASFYIKLYPSDPERNMPYRLDVMFEAM